MRLRLAALTLVLLAGSAQAAEVHGNGDLGFWFLQNNVSDGKGFVLDDGYGVTHVQNRYTLANFGLRLDALDMTDSPDGPKLNSHFKGRLLWNVGERTESLAFPDKTRQQIDDLALELAGIHRAFDVWAGRQTIYETGGVGVDGLRGIYHVSDEVDVGLYGGLTNDPRNLTGYIGPSYRSALFSSRFQAGGIYITNRGERLRLDAALNAQLYKAKLDRFTLFSQASYQLNPVWSFSGSADLGLAKDTGVKSVQALISSRPTPRITNTLSFARFVALRYKESNVSAIPVPAGIDATLVNGADVDTSSYNIGKEQIQIRVYDRNYIFGSFQFARRTFDHKNQLKYTAGYRDPELFGSTFDLRLQTDVIDNYLGFNTLFDALVGKEFFDGKLRLEGGGTYYANERDTFSEVEKESSLRFNVYGFASSQVSWLLNYALHLEKDLMNNGQKIKIHDLYLATNFRF